MLEMVHDILGNYLPKHLEKEKCCHKDKLPEIYVIS